MVLGTHSEGLMMGWISGVSAIFCNLDNLSSRIIDNLAVNVFNSFKYICDESESEILTPH